MCFLIYGSSCGSSLPKFFVFFIAFFLGEICLKLEDDLQRTLYPLSLIDRIVSFFQTWPTDSLSNAPHNFFI